MLSGFNATSTYINGLNYFNIKPRGRSGGNQLTRVEEREKHILDKWKELEIKDQLEFNWDESKWNC